MRALELGCNVIDTSANYSDGGSEHVIGDVIHEMTRHLKVLQRDVRPWSIDRALTLN